MSNRIFIKAYCIGRKNNIAIKHISVFGHCTTIYNMQRWWRSLQCKLLLIPNFFLRPAFVHMKGLNFVHCDSCNWATTHRVSLFYHHCDLTDLPLNVSISLDGIPWCLWKKTPLSIYNTYIFTERTLNSFRLNARNKNWKSHDFTKQPWQE